MDISVVERMETNLFPDFISILLLGCYYAGVSYDSGDEWVSRSNSCQYYKCQVSYAFLFTNVNKTCQSSMCQ